MRGWGTIASLIWAVAVAAYATGYVRTLSPTGGELMLVSVGFLAAGLVPVALIWWAGHLSDALSAREAWGEALEGEVTAVKDAVADLSARLQSAERDLAECPRPAPPVPDTSPDPIAAPTPEPLTTPVKPQEPPTAIAETTPTPAPDAVSEADEVAQPDLPLQGGANAGELNLGETIQALNFPQDAQDQAGFAVLKRALQSHDLAKLLQASEDCLNLLAHEGIYTDDLMPAPAGADDWRQFSKGGAARAELMPLTGITDTAALEAVRRQMRGDPIFRDTALYFQRRFDRMLQDAASEASDGELLQLVDTRSGRAFVLLVQVGGMSDPHRG